MQEKITIEYQVFNSILELAAPDAELVAMARAATANAYAPYSGFSVAAAALLSNGVRLTATNQENASYPVGVCAERSLLATVGALHPNEPVATMAISYKSQHGPDDRPVAPCGMCRQSLAEYAQRTHTGIRLLLAGQIGQIWVFQNANSLLPLSFSGSDL
ncbi:MAG: cytidine deaminase [Bacteroidetes bacterium]|nr:MAG: cytidine deaminase [Bacteroidota bacterium]